MTPRVPPASAQDFERRLREHQSDVERQKIQRYFKSEEGEYGEGDEFMGVRMGDVFALAKEFVDLPVGEIEKLLESPIHEVRAGAVSIMGKSAAGKKTTEDRRRELFDLFLRRHDRINNWDLVDLGAWHVVGRHLVDKPRDVLYQLAGSSSLWERRTAMLATMAFIRRGELDDAYRLAELLLHDEQPLIHKAVGWALREVGKHDEGRFRTFLDRYAATMPRQTLRYAIERLEKSDRDRYLKMKA